MKRNKKWSFIMAVVLATVSLVAAVAPAMAQADDEAAAEAWTSVDGLAIIAPIITPPEQPVTMTVLQRSDAAPVEGAGVWALTREDAAALRERLAALHEDQESSPADVDWEAAVEANGEFLGRTDEFGKLTHTFVENGRYVLYAVKKGYVPGRTTIGIGRRVIALGIRAPERAPVGETVLMTVFQRGTHDPVEGAGVWALTRESAESLSEETAALREAGEDSLEDADWEALLDIRGTFLGRTDEFGNLENAFDEAGRYLLVTAKRGYLPGRNGIGIGIPNFMAMEVQRWAQPGESVPMTVFERGSGDPVEGAGIWALTRDDAEVLREEMATLREAGDSSLAETDWEALVSVHGFLLGHTDERGYLEHAFDEPGGYALVSVKRGYVPSHAFIVIRAPRVQPEHQLQRGQPAPFQNGVSTETY